MSVTQKDYDKIQIFLDEQKSANSDPTWQAKFISQNTKAQMIAAMSLHYSNKKTALLADKSLVDSRAQKQKESIDAYISEIDSLIINI